MLLCNILPYPLNVKCDMNYQIYVAKPLDYAIEDAKNAIDDVKDKVEKTVETTINGIKITSIVLLLIGGFILYRVVSK